MKYIGKYLSAEILLTRECTIHYAENKLKIEQHKYNRKPDVKLIDIFQGFSNRK
jgi:hypothetical protein